MMITLAFDPSGNHVEGKGTTGFAVAHDEKLVIVGYISAADYPTPEEYWNAHVQLIKDIKPHRIVLEGYRLYHHRGMSASSQANSILETPQLIGVLRLVSHSMKIPCKVQYAAEVKQRWSDQILANKNIIIKKGASYYFEGKKSALKTHEKDAIRHLMHYLRYSWGEN